MSASLSFDDLETIADTLATGFLSLLDKIDEQKEIESKLRDLLESAFRQVSQPVDTAPIPFLHDELFFELALEQSHSDDIVDLQVIA